MRVLHAPDSKLRKLLCGEQAQDLVEYGLALSLIALALISGMNNVATALVKAFTNISSSLTPATAPPPRQDYNRFYPTPWYNQPGFEQAPSGYELAAWEPGFAATTCKQIQDGPGARA